MNGCEDCIKTIRAEHGEMSIDLCKMLGTCTCNHDATELHVHAMKREVKI